MAVGKHSRAFMGLLKQKETNNPTKLRKIHNFNYHLSTGLGVLYRFSPTEQMQIHLPYNYQFWSKLETKARF